MIMLRKYKSVVFWLIFVSLWIIGCDPRCNDEDEDEIKKIGKRGNNNKPNIIPENYISNNGFTNQNADIINLGNDKANDYNNNLINDNNNMLMMNNPMQNNNNLVYPQNQNQNQISYQGQIINLDPNNNPFNNNFNNYNNQQSQAANMQFLSPTNMNMNPYLNQNQMLEGQNNNLIPIYNQPQNNNNSNNNNINNILDQTTNADLSNVILKNIGYISSKFQEEPQIGLANIGATCYMNATLQCLSHTLNLSNYFLNKKNEKLIRSKQLAKGYLEVIKQLWLKPDNGKKYYKPYNFKKLISDMNPLFQGIAANDSKDLVNFIIQQLHEELNKPNLNQVNNNVDEINQYDENAMFSSFFEEFRQKQRSVISDNFYFFIETQTECLNCRQINQMRGNNNPIYLYNFQIMHFLIFPLEEVRKYKIMQYQQNFNEVNLFDCFDYNQKIDIMQGENQMWCRGCRQNAPSQYRTLICSAPKYLILILNRGKGNVFNVKLNFPEILDIGNFVRIKQSDNLIYHLYAIVTHLGPSSMAGHFIAFCKSPIDNLWYKYNDAIVECVGNFYKDILNFGTPYILFYECQNQ